MATRTSHSSTLISTRLTVRGCWGGDADGYQRPDWLLNHTKKGKVFSSLSSPPLRQTRKDPAGLTVLGLAGVGGGDEIRFGWAVLDLKCKCEER